MYRHQPFTRTTLFLLLFVMVISSTVRAAMSQLPDQLMVERRFVPTGWMGDGQLSTQHISLLEASTDNPHSEPTCVKITYQQFGSNGWGGIYWQNVADNWGEEPGIDLSGGGYKSITFWARGNSGTEYVEFGSGGIQRDGLPHKDSIFATAGKVLLTTDWRKYYIWRVKIFPA